MLVAAVQPRAGGQNREHSPATAATGRGRARCVGLVQGRYSAKACHAVLLLTQVLHSNYSLEQTQLVHHSLLRLNYSVMTAFAQSAVQLAGS